MNYNELYEAIIRSIYAKHNPDKLNELDGIFHKYQGREKELLEKVSKKYAVTQSELNIYAEEYHRAFAKPKPRLPILMGIVALILLVGAGLLIRRNNNQEVSANNPEISETTKSTGIGGKERDEKPVEKKDVVIKEFTAKELGRALIDGCGCGYVNIRKELKPANLLLTKSWDERPVAYMHIDGEVMKFIYLREDVEKGHAVSIYKSGEYFLIETIKESKDDDADESTLIRGQLQIRNQETGANKVIEFHGACDC